MAKSSLPYGNDKKKRKREWLRYDGEGTDFPRRWKIGRDTERRMRIEERFLDCAGQRVRWSERGRKNVGPLRSK